MTADPAELVAALASGYLGLILGAFLTVLVPRLERDGGALPWHHRLLRPKESVCPDCGRRLPWSEKFPLVGFLRVRGRCAGCGAHLSWRDPMMELQGLVLGFGLGGCLELPAALAATGGLVLAGAWSRLEASRWGRHHHAAQGPPRALGALLPVLPALPIVPPLVGLALILLAAGEAAAAGSPRPPGVA